SRDSNEDQVGVLLSGFSSLTSLTVCPNVDRSHRSGRSADMRETGVPDGLGGQRGREEAGNRDRQDDRGRDQRGGQPSMSLLNRKPAGWVSSLLLPALLAGCAQSATTRATRRDKTLEGAGIGALSGAALSVAMGKRKADQILTGTAIGAGIGAGVGAYMDA